LNVDMLLPLAISTTEGMQNVMVDKKGTKLKSDALPVIDPDMYYLKKIIIE